MDPNYAFYLHMENLKNSLYRQLSSAKRSGLFWPKFYYSWFYADEKTLYNILNFRQKLGTKISETEINAYNEIRVIKVKIIKYIESNKTLHSLCIKAQRSVREIRRWYNCSLF